MGLPSTIGHWNHLWPHIAGDKPRRTVSAAARSRFPDGNLQGANVIEQTPWRGPIAATVFVPLSISGCPQLAAIQEASAPATLPATPLFSFTPHLSKVLAVSSFNMKLLATGLLAGTVAAFPFRMDELVAPLKTNEAFQEFKRAKLEGRAATPPQGAGALPATPPPFDAATQYVSNQGTHKFVAPGAGDARGECPGLNALANHGYLPHNGVATIQQFIDGTNAGFGMAKDLGGFLAVFGALIDGDGAGWSIGGVPHTGILGSHNNYETDSSPLKSDLNQYGSNTKLIMSQFYNVWEPCT